MLYNPKWGKPEVKADPLSLDSLIEWLEKQPLNNTYCYMDTGACLLGQYFRDAFECRAIVGGNSFSLFDGRFSRALYVPIPHDFSDVAWPMPRTFGAALERARAFQSVKIV